jgi:hypothetical protein
MPRLLASLALLLFAAAPLSAQSSADSAGIRGAALDYIDGWWTGDVDRMTRALHPDLAKRIMGRDQSGATRLNNMTAAQLIGGVRAGGGKDTPAAERKSEVRILDIFGNAATARIDAGAWIDYLHLAKAGDRWQIVNVLWELRRSGT